MTAPSPASPLLRLPLELRYAIYDHLCTPSPHNYPVQSPSPITAASFSFFTCPLPLLLTCRSLLRETCTYYFTRCTFRFVAQSFHTHNADKDHMSRASLHLVRNMRIAELVLLPGTTKATPSDPWPSVMVKSMSPTWLDEQVRLLREEARELKKVVVSIRRVSWDHAWSMRDEMEALLKPLADLGRVEFEVGEVVGPSAIEESMMTEMAKILERFNSQEAIRKTSI